MHTYLLFVFTRYHRISVTVQTTVYGFTRLNSIILFKSLSKKKNSEIDLTIEISIMIAATTHSLEQENILRDVTATKTV